jgi:hypothetical protein
VHFSDAFNDFPCRPNATAFEALVFMFSDNEKVLVSITDGVRGMSQVRFPMVSLELVLHNPSSHTMTLG